MWLLMFRDSEYTRNVYYIGNLEMARLANGTVTFYNLDGDEIEKKPTQIKWDAEAAEKAGYEHFMLKEIHEQPKAVRDTVNSVVRDGKIDLSGVGITEEEIQKLYRRAGEYYEQNDRIPKAFQLYEKAGDQERLKEFFDRPQQTQPGCR